MMDDRLNAFSDEQLRVAGNLQQRYDAWADAIRRREGLPTSMYFARRGEREYLIVKRHSRDNGTSEGARDAATEARLAAYLEDREAADRAISRTSEVLAEIVTLYRTLRLPLAMPKPGRLLRELDLAGLLGSDVMAVGTTAFVVYQLEATARFAKLSDETEDFDLAWCRGSGIALAQVSDRRPPLLEILRKVDPSVRVAAFPEQEWLLAGRPVRHVVVARDGKPCPIFAPDPRWMALHKLWLARKPERNAVKRPKDFSQGTTLLHAVAERMSASYPLDTDFVMDLPPELREVFDEWATANAFMPMPPSRAQMR